MLSILDDITAALSSAADRKSEEFQVLRKALGYCWSVAVAALPDTGRPMMERWFASPDKDIQWIMKENLKKNRLEHMDAGWVQESKARLGVK